MNKKRKSKAGMTLVEAVVFLSLTVTIMMSSMAVTVQTKKLVHSDQEAVEAFMFNKSSAEELMALKYDEITNDFTEAVSGVYKKVVENSPIATPDECDHVIKLTKKEGDEVGNYYEVSNAFSWDSSSTNSDQPFGYTIHVYEALPGS